jgi:hypothetical protein
MAKYEWPAYFVRVPGDSTFGYVVVATTEVFRQTYKAAFRRFIAKSAFKLLVHSPSENGQDPRAVRSIQDVYRSIAQLTQTT